MHLTQVLQRALVVVAALGFDLAVVELDTGDDLLIMRPEANELLKVVLGNRESNELLGLVVVEPVTEAANIKAETTIVNEIMLAKIIYISSFYTPL